MLSWFFNKDSTNEKGTGERYKRMFFGGLWAVVLISCMWFFFEVSVMLNIRGLDMKKQPRGFTLIEVLVVVVIIAVLASLVIPRLANQNERGVVAEAVATLSAIRQAEASWSLEQVTPAYTATLANLDLDVTSTKFSYTIVVTTGPPPTFTATATRLPNSGSCSTSNFGSCTIVLTDTGAWSGTHPYAPT